ncbi:T9SS type A sorting domain-containing protein [candidate division KSB1 bacterium]|nr:T9SS type A sorting domain-containing protein [candidate division KSB1 bacterium]
MNKLLLFFTYAIILNTTLTVGQPDWRFGFEWNEGGLTWNDPHILKLLSTLQETGANGGINVNGLGSWANMQKSPGAEIDFTTTDAVVKVFQQYGFSLTWYISSNAYWAMPDKPECCPDTVHMTDPIPDILIYRNCAPKPGYEQAWIDFLKAVVERYDGDGKDDMPNLLVPVRYYILPGEIRYGMEGQGDDVWGPFWWDDIDGLLRLHRLTYKAVQEADPTGSTIVVSSGAVLWDLFADFPDWPEFDPVDPNSTIRKRLDGANYHNKTFSAGWDSLKKMLKSFGDDSDGIECDYVGWHPHFSWRIIPQEFAFIHAYAGNKSVYVDDMWSNIFPRGYYAPAVPPLPGIPGYAVFNAPANPFSATDWITRLFGDFPNPLFTLADPFAELFQKLNQDDPDVLEWYYANGARQLVKSFACAFGEGAVTASYSGSNDLPASLVPHTRGWPGGWINLTGTRQEDYFKKPQYHTFKIMVEKLKDFTTAKEITVSENPRTRVYEFERSQRGPVYVLWSETGPPPPDLDYRIPTGESVTFRTQNNDGELVLTHIITDTANIVPDVEILKPQNGQFSVQLGYEPFFLEGDVLTRIENHPDSRIPGSFRLLQNYPNPFNDGTVVPFYVPRKSFISLVLYDITGQIVTEIVKSQFNPGYYEIPFETTALASGIYFITMKTGDFVEVKKTVLLK